MDLEELARRTENYVGGDIEALCREAAILALRESNMEAEKVSWRHFEEAMAGMQASVTKEDIERYRELDKQFRRARDNISVKSGVI